MKLTRHENNPIVVPGGADWRKAAVFNPGVVQADGKYYMYERAAGSLRPFQTCIGLLESEDGVNFRPVLDEPVFTAEMLGYPGGSVEDARVVRIDGLYYMCYALQPYGFDCWPTGTGLPAYYPEHYPEWADNGVEPMITRSGIAVSVDGIHFKPLSYTTPAEIDDRDNALFPEKIGGRFAILRRPLQYVGEKYGTNSPGMWISYSDNLFDWTEPELVAVAENPEWEGTKIGAAATPIRTDRGWLVLYHGVDARSVYRVGALLLDLEDPKKVIARTREPIMEPETYYEKFGLVLPNVVFPTANLVIDGLLYIYYGCCDTSIALATVPLNELLDAMTDEAN
ncbi:glycosidase [Paenibacillus sp. JDR-2]|uniref:glycoside hydrolase family 130 protein n=1 Tax=Paenibacillus sp. (strain JDR-2) TaxID=324057 RepID=UPI0001664A9B|nr:glycosidase [Paenibacillus sp. JDR-2]ACT03688.1 glycosidase PH1107-related [Paenibacillus sp. JDR-2]